MASLSKISRLPRSVRDDLNRRLDDGERGAAITTWLNAVPAVKKIIDRDYEGVPVSDQNLSVWRETGFFRYQEENTRLHELKERVAFSKKMAGSAREIFAGSAAVGGGVIMDVMESLDPDAIKSILAENPENFVAVMRAFAAMSKAQMDQDRTALAKEKHAQSGEKLSFDREKFETAQAAAVLKHAQSKAVQDIAKGSGSNAAKIAATRALMFPVRPAKLQEK